MTNNSNPYEPEPRLIDDPDKLRELYNERGLTIREIATNHAEVGRTSVCDALSEFGLIGGDKAGTDTGIEEIDVSSSNQVDWTLLSD